MIDDLLIYRLYKKLEHPCLKILSPTIAFNKYVTYVEIEIVLWAFGIVRLRAESIV